jgi:hypothetical protein
LGNTSSRHEIWWGTERMARLSVLQDCTVGLYCNTVLHDCIAGPSYLTLLHDRRLVRLDLACTLALCPNAVGGGYCQLPTQLQRSRPVHHLWSAKSRSCMVRSCRPLSGCSTLSPCMIKAAPHEHICAWVAQKHTVKAQNTGHRYSIRWSCDYFLPRLYVQHPSTLVWTTSEPLDS